jgi:hypothetical protein
VKFIIFFEKQTYYVHTKYLIIVTGSAKQGRAQIHMCVYIIFLVDFVIIENHQP